MLEERHIEAIREVQETIVESLNDSRGLLPRQRRLVSMLSLGMAHLIEIYFHRLHAIKPGSQIKHDWFASERRKLKMHLAGNLTKDIDSLPKIDKILELAHEIELKRNELVYGAVLKNDLLMREKLDFYLELKKEIEQIIGEIR